MAYPNTLIQSKQIAKFFRAPVYVAGFAFPAAATANVTAALTTSVATAGQGGVAVPAQVYTIGTNHEGFVLADVVEVWNDTTQGKLADGNNNEVYGRLGEAGGVYTLSLFTRVAGVETAYTLPAAVTVGFGVAYRYSFDHLPENAFIGADAVYLGDDPSSTAVPRNVERMTPTGVNTLPAAAQAYRGAGAIYLHVNGKTESSLGGAPAFTMAGTAITWSEANAGYALATTDEVVADYPIAG